MPRFPLLETIGSAVTRRLFSPRQEREALPPVSTTAFGSFAGVPPPIKAGEGIKVYQQNPWVYAAVNAITGELCQTDIFLRRRIQTAKGIEYERVYEHQALDLLTHPLPQDDGRSHLNGLQLRELTFIHLLSAGEGIWYLGNRLRGIPYELSPLMPQFVEVKLDQENRIQYYEYNFMGKVTRYDPADIVHLKRIDPTSIYRGQSSYLSAGMSIDTDRESDSYLWHYFKNRALPDAILLRQNAPSKEDIERWKEMWQNLYQGAKNAGKIAMAWGGTDLKVLGSNQRDMQFKELKEYNRDVIMANLRTGKGVIGMMEDQSRANAEAQDYVFARRVIRPLLVQYVTQLTTDYLPLFGNVEGLEFWFDDPVKADETQKATVHTTLLNAGVESINEVRKEFGLDPREESDADRIWTSLSRMPILTDEEKAAEEEANAALADKIATGGAGDEPADDQPEEDDMMDGDEEMGAEVRALLERASQSKKPLPKNADSLLNDRKEREAILADISPVVDKTYRKGIEIGHDQVGNAEFTDAQLFNLPAAQDALKELKLRYAVSTLKTTKKDLNRLINHALADGLSNADLARNIRSLYGEQYAGYRSLRIARTEVTNVINAGVHDTLDYEGVKKKRWIATLDDRTRESHYEEMQDTVRGIPIDQSFNLDGNLCEFPGDETLPPEDRINCRCTVVNGDLDAFRTKPLAKLFLREHGSLEGAMAKVIRRSFKRQLTRVLERLS